MASPTRLARVGCVSDSGGSTSSVNGEGVCSVRACVLMLVPPAMEQSRAIALKQVVLCLILHGSAFR